MSTSWLHSLSLGSWSFGSENSHNWTIRYFLSLHKYAPTSAITGDFHWKVCILGNNLLDSVRRSDLKARRTFVIQVSAVLISPSATIQMGQSIKTKWAFSPGSLNQYTVSCCLPGEQNWHVMVQRVFISFHVEFLLPLAEAVQAVVGVVCNL